MSKKGNDLNQFLAGRWAAKEAIYKALPNFTGEFKDINIQYVNNKPTYETEKYNIFLSISHESKYAVAYAIVTEK
jgi:holo-[acyl-carrier protein] synthase